MVNFLQSCNERLKQGESGADVLSAMREHYSSSIRCLRVKCGVLRKMYDGTENDDFVKALDTLKCEFPDQAEVLESCRHPTLSRGIDVSSFTTHPDLYTKIKQLPSRLPQNVRDVHITTFEAKECKRLALKVRLAATIKKERIHGSEMLKIARNIISNPKSKLYETVVALLLLTGRRMCEICNGKSSFTPIHNHIVSFKGQAKRRTGDDDTFEIPVLATAEEVENALSRVRLLQKNIPDTNEKVSSKYASGLNEFVKKHVIFKDAKHIHNLRKIYACMALKLFDWGDAGDLFIAMNILGHGDVDEPIVYNVFDVGDLSNETHLGCGSVLSFPVL